MFAKMQPSHTSGASSPTELHVDAPSCVLLLRETRALLDREAVTYSDYLALYQRVQAAVQTCHHGHCDSNQAMRALHRHLQQLLEMEEPPL